MSATRSTNRVIYYTPESLTRAGIGNLITNFSKRHQSGFAPAASSMSIARDLFRATSTAPMNRPMIVQDVAETPED